MDSSSMNEDAYITKSSSEFTPSTSATVEEIVETIGAMCHQEVYGYNVMDYLLQSTGMSMDGPLDIDRECRTKMVAWSYQVIDFCKFNRETVEIAMSCLDRFLITPTGAHALQDRSVYQLAAMTSLYTAVKIHEPEAMDPSLVSNLSRGTYSSTEIEEMEFILLQSLAWKCNPPTTMSFVREFFQLISYDAIDIPTRKVIYELCKYQSEYAISNHDYIEMKSSEKAYCSIMNALTWLGYDTNVMKYISIIIQNTTQLSTSTCSHTKQEQRLLQNHLYNHAILQHPTILAAESTLVSPKQPIDSRQRSTLSVSPRSSIISLEEV